MSKKNKQLPPPVLNDYEEMYGIRSMTEAVIAGTYPVKRVNVYPHHITIMQPRYTLYSIAMLQQVYKPTPKRSFWQRNQAQAMIALSMLYFVVLAVLVAKLGG